MRFSKVFLAIMAVALLLGAAWAVCPRAFLYVSSDRDLPDSTAWQDINPVKCQYVEWEWRFNRTAKNDDGKAVVCAAIESTNVSICINSDEITTPGSYYRCGTGLVTGSSIRAIMEYGPMSDDTGYFIDLVFKYTTR